MKAFVTKNTDVAGLKKMKEIWKDIDGYEGLYQVSNLGRIKSLPKQDGFHFLKEKIKTLFLKRNGYLMVSLSIKGIGKQNLVHRIVAKAFIPNPENLPQVNHKDENKLNNRVDNLEWCTAKYNMNYGTCLERRAKTQRESGCQINNKGSSTPIICIENNVIYPSIREAERKLHLDGSCISKVCRGLRKRAGGFTFAYI